MRTTLDILAEAGLADKELAREQLRAQRDAANSQALSSGLVGALGVLTNVGLKGADIYKQGVADDANTAAQSLVAQHKSDLGQALNETGGMENPYYGNTPADVAGKAVAGAADLNPEKPSGLWDSLSSLIGDKEAAAAKARANAQTQIVGDVTANRTTAGVQARQQREDAAKLQNEANARDAAAAAKAQAQANTDRAYSLEEDKAAADENAKSFTEQDARAKAVADQRLKQEEINAKARGQGGPPSQKSIDEEKLRQQAIAKGEAEAAARDAPPGLTKEVTSDTQKKKIAAQLTLAKSDKLRALLSDPELAGYTGPLSGVAHFLQGKTGELTQKQQQLLTAIGRNSDAYRVATTGAGASGKELEMLASRVPQDSDTLKQAFGKLDANDGDAQTAMELYDSLLGTQPSQSSSQSTATPAPSGSGVVPRGRATPPPASALNWRE